jgi:hypothetical protein
MRDYNSAVEKLRSDAAEAELIRDVVAFEAKREMFGRLPGTCTSWRTKSSTP